MRRYRQFTSRPCSRQARPFLAVLLDQLREVLHRRAAEELALADALLLALDAQRLRREREERMARAQARAALRGIAGEKFARMMTLARDEREVA